MGWPSHYEDDVNRHQESSSSFNSSAIIGPAGHEVTTPALKPKIGNSTPVVIRKPLKQTRCPICHCLINAKNLDGHIRRVHAVKSKRKYKRKRRASCANQDGPLRKKVPRVSIQASKPLLPLEAYWAIVVNEFPTCQRDTATSIMAELSEDKPKVFASILVLLESLGNARTTGLVQESTRIYQDKGDWTNDRSRKRTVGGIFFRLANLALGGHMKDIFRQRLPSRREVSDRLDTNQNKDARINGVHGSTHVGRLGKQ